MSEPLDLDDIQGLVARGYGSLPYACFLVLGIDDGAAARDTIAGWASSVTSAAAPTSSEAINLAFTAAGLRALADGADLPGGFSEQFAAGMVTAHRSRFLGDRGDADPSGWRWGGPSSDPVHVLALLYAADLAELERMVAAMDGRDGDTGLRLLTRLDTGELSDREPFGFRDGISQPPVRGLPRAGDAADAVAAGEFVLGYRNEYGQLTERPLLPAEADPGHVLPRDGTGAADLGRNGSYLVLRQLRQDVEGFWRCVEDASRRTDGTPDPDRRDLLAAKIVGRWPSGTSLVLAPERDDPSRGDANDFGYAADPAGLACPVGAHVRRANPRDSLEPDPGTPRSLAINRRHRLLRRGRNYGPAGELGGDGTDERGIHFLCLNANLARQYEFVQHTWINNPNFDGLYDDADPLVAPQAADATFTEPARPVRRRHRDLPRFVRVRGGAYFFLPGLAALHYLTGKGMTR